MSGMSIPIPFSRICCTCHTRFGAHRVSTYACPNQKWRPGNGEPQWLTAVFLSGPQPATAPRAARQSQPEQPETMTKEIS